MLIVYTGQYGSGKSVSMSTEMHRLCARELRLEKKKEEYKRRLLVTNLHLNPNFAEWYGHENIIVWKDVTKLPTYKNAIIIWDEITVDMDSHQWETLPHAVKVWLRQIRKLNITILATAQSFVELNRSARRRTAKAYFCRSIFTSPTPTDYEPNPPVYGVIWRREIAKKSFHLDEDEMEFSDTIGEFSWISRTKAERFNTLQMFEMGDMPALTHVERRCETCGFRKTVHY